MPLALLVTLSLAVFGRHACAAAAPLSSWLESATAIEPWIIERQEELHKIPELLFETPKTYATLERYLTDIGVKHRCGVRRQTDARDWSVILGCSDSRTVLHGSLAGLLNSLNGFTPGAQSLERG